MAMMLNPVGRHVNNVAAEGGREHTSMRACLYA